MGCLTPGTKTKYCLKNYCQTMDTELAVIYLLLSWKIDHSWIDYPVLKLAPLRSWGFNNEPVCVSRDSLPTVYKIYGCYDVHVNIKIRWNFKSQLKPTPKMLWVCYCVWNAISHLFFLCEVPKYRSSCTVCWSVRDFTQLYRMCLTKQGYGLCWNCKWSPLWVCCWCVHTSAHHIWSNSGL